MTSINEAIYSYTIDNLYGCQGNVNIIGGGKPLKELTVIELREIAKQLNIKGRWGMKQDELVKAIRQKARAKKVYTKNF